MLFMIKNKYYQDFFKKNIKKTLIIRHSPAFHRLFQYD